MGEELELRIKIPAESLRLLGTLIAENLSQHLTLQPSPQLSFEAVSEPSPRLFIVGHKVVIPRLNGFQEIADAVQRFSRLEEASEDVAIYQINRLSLWKAAEQGLTPDEVVEVLKLHSRTPPKPSLRNWVARTMSAYGVVRIVAGEGFNILETADKTILDRLLSFRDVKGCIYRRLGPTQARIIQGKRAELKRLLLDKGYPVKDYGLMEEFKPIDISLKPEFEPRDYQLEALERFLKAGSGVVILPPGTGKTVIAVMITASLRAPTLILCTRAEICKQFKAEYLRHTTLSPYEIAVITGETPYRQRVVKPITITTYQMATSRHLRDIWRTKWGLVVFDESQHIPGDVWSRVIHIQAIRRLGLTACIDGETKILTRDGWREVRSINPSTQVYSLSPNFELEEREAFVFKAEWGDRYPLRIRTMSGKSIVLTNDHPLLSLNNFKPRFKKAEQLKIGDLVATTTFNPTSKEEEIYRLLGFAYGDGNLRFGTSENDLRLVFTVNSSEKDALVRILERVGCKVRVDKKGDRDAYNIEVLRRGSKIHLPRILYDLGCPIGNKRKQPIPFPKIPEEGIIPFLCGLFGAEGYTPKLRKRNPRYKSQYIDNLGLRMNTEREEWLLPFFKRISEILTELGILNKIKVIPTNYGTKAIEIRIRYNLQNAKRFLHLILYAYSPIKQREANNVLAFILAKEILRRKRLKAIKEGKVNQSVLWSWSRGLHRDVQIRGMDIPEIPTTSDIRWEEIVEISPIEQKNDIYDLRVPKLMNFVANGFISHNTPIREDAKEKMIFAWIGPPLIDRAWLEMAKERWIAEAELYEVLIELPSRLRGQYERSGDWEKVLITAMNPNKIKAVKEILRRHRGEPTLIINFYVDSALKLGEALNIPVITGKTSKKRRHELYEGFRRGDIKTLVVTSVGEEGIDLPNAKVGINYNGLYGSRMGFTQRFGRILRPKKGKAVFYELITEGTVEEEYSERRRAYLLSKGYEFNTLHLTPSGLRR